MANECFVKNIVLQSPKDKDTDISMADNNHSVDREHFNYIVKENVKIEDEY